jgi:hypothetical protein
MHGSPQESSERGVLNGQEAPHNSAALRRLVKDRNMETETFFCLHFSVYPSGFRVFRVFRGSSALRENGRRYES